MSQTKLEIKDVIIKIPFSFLQRHDLSTRSKLLIIVFLGMQQEAGKECFNASLNHIAKILRVASLTARNEILLLKEKRYLSFENTDIAHDKIYRLNHAKIEY